MMGWIGVLTGSPRLAILSLLILFAGGFLLLFWVKVPEQSVGEEIGSGSAK